MIYNNLLYILNYNENINIIHTLIYSLIVLSFFVFIFNVISYIGLILYSKPGKILDAAAKGSQIIIALGTSITAYKSLGGGSGSNENNKDKETPKDESKNPKNTSNQTTKQNVVK